MARLRAGILGNIRGKVAGVVGGQWKDKNYVREYVKPANPRTAAQIVQRDLMQGAVAFAKPLVGPVFNAYTDKFQKSMSGFNYFIKQNITEFVTDPTWDNMVLTEGKLYAQAITEASYDSGTGQNTITWTPAYGNNGAASDKVFAAQYDKDSGFWTFPATEELRSTGEITITGLTGLTFGNLKVYVWCAQYAGALVNLISTSVYEQTVSA